MLRSHQMTEPMTACFGMNKKTGRSRAEFPVHLNANEGDAFEGFGNQQHVVNIPDRKGQIGITIIRARS